MSFVTCCENPQKSENHKKFTSTQKNYSIGGILLIIFFTLNYLNRMEYLNTLFYFLIFSIGLLSDLKTLNSPKLRFLLQIFFLILFILLLDIRIFNTRIDIFDELLKNNVLNYFCKDEDTSMIHFNVYAIAIPSGYDLIAIELQVLDTWIQARFSYSDNIRLLILQLILQFCMLEGTNQGLGVNQQNRDTRLRNWFRQ